MGQKGVLCLSLASISSAAEGTAVSLGDALVLPYLTATPSSLIPLE